MPQTGQAQVVPLGAQGHPCPRKRSRSPGCDGASEPPTPAPEIYVDVSGRAVAGAGHNIYVGVGDR